MLCDVDTSMTSWYTIQHTNSTWIQWWIKIWMVKIWYTSNPYHGHVIDTYHIHCNIHIVIMLSTHIIMHYSLPASWFNADSGLGYINKQRITNNTCFIPCVGSQSFFKVLTHISPEDETLGWKSLVRKWAFGGDAGKSVPSTSLTRKRPPTMAGSHDHKDDEMSGWYHNIKYMLSYYHHTISHVPVHINIT